MNRNIPEPRTEPPEQRCVIASGCGHEVYTGELLIEWHDGKKFVFICPECFRDKINVLGITELAEQFGCEFEVVK